ncbi:uncharacterized protein [Lepeophtheirus salmonis]|uniref:palmitoyl-protein hydrolase n=2 Tax=Lepeophtheirus salmonis TaxID=72036 RepID=C1BTJ5_LEPSM|nr:acyl-protein thioesterase 1-like isoform X2 [Lepeophtheirus salmonis]ACO12348.1 Acyl-protein thioesterase 1 [Lepeophtheirus salmonis]
MTSIPPVVLKASVKHSATMIFLHGLGDTGFGWAGALNTIRPKYMKIVCPTANSIPVTCNGGMSMPAWYDILDINAIGGKREHLESLEASSANLDLLIEQEEYEVPRNRIILGGFSQGGALALHNVLKNKDRTLGGAIALSAYIAGGDVPSLNGPKLTTPLLQVHGEIDEIVPYSRGVEASNILKELFSQFRFKGYPHMGHEGSSEEMQLLKDFIQDFVPPIETTST